MKVKELMKLAEQNGWVYVRTRGDHHIYKKPGVAMPLSIPGKPSSDVRIGTEKSLLKLIGMGA